MKKTTFRSCLFYITMKMGRAKGDLLIQNRPCRAKGTDWGAFVQDGEVAIVDGLAFVQDAQVAVVDGVFHAVLVEHSF